jgi:hypothetical protein
MDIVQVMRLRALKAVLYPDSEYFLRKIIRWYSKTFSTPIEKVEEIPVEEILQAFYEERYEAMSEEQLEEERETLIKDPEELRAEQLLEDQEEVDSFETRRIIAAEEEAQKKAAAQKKAKLLEAPQQVPGPLAIKPMQETTLVSGPAPAIPPGITMSFESDKEFEKLLDQEGLGGFQK